MTLVLYELCDASEQPMSPYCWRIHESLLLLSIPFESRLLGLTDIRQHFTGKNRTVPVLLDGENEIEGSWKIAEYLSEHHDPRNRLLGENNERRLTTFATNWVDAALLGPVNRMVVKDIHDGFKPADQAYYRTSEEKRQGQTLEDAQAEREKERPFVQKLLHPARMAIKQQPFIGGQYPTYADFALHSTFKWIRAVTNFEFLRPDDRLNEWINRMDDWVISRSSVVEITTSVL